jgi:hypothetical protein
VLNREDKLGTHTFRKTGYLFARLGGAKRAEIMTGADHHSDKVANCYDKGTAAMTAVIKLSRNLENRVGKYRNPSAIQSEVYKRVTVEHVEMQKPLSVLPSAFWLVSVDVGKEFEPLKLPTKWNHGTGSAIVTLNFVLSWQTTVSRHHKKWSHVCIR